MLNLEGRTAVVFGLANKRSIAWAIAQKLHAAGVNLAVSYQNERLRADAEDLVADLNGAQLFQCDVSSDADIDRVFAELKERYGKLHMCLCTASALLPPTRCRTLSPRPRRESFRIAHDVSVYSLIAAPRGAAPLMTDGGSIITLTYYGAEKSFRATT